MNNIDEPREVLEYDDSEDFDGKVLERVTYGCPECLATVIPWQKRCHECEQALKWIGNEYQSKKIVVGGF